ncbi:MAG: septum formation initiator family protein [Bryobacteraceae bacterium]|nr:septum formation initiator family protein [Bryobacteraceae bacterium]
MRAILVLACLTLGGVYAVLAMRGPMGIPALQNKWQQIRARQQENADLRRDIELRRDHIQRLQKNVSQQELEIRKQLKMLRPGETTFILPEASKPEAAGN